MKITIKEGLRSFSVLLLIIGISGCGYFQSQSDRDREEGKWPEERLYKMAKEKLDFGSCTGAIEYYEKLQARYPFGIYTQQSQIELAFCYYRTDDPNMAMVTIDRFIKLYPSHPNMAYAFYLRGLINFGRGRGLIDRWLPKDGSQRDPGLSLESFNDFSEVVKSFPESIYVTDARLRMRFLRNQLAQHEVNVANYYMRRGAYVASANRARYVVEKYQQTPSVPEALILLAKSYKILELNDLADDALKVLELNYPNHMRVEEVKQTEVQ